MRSQRRDGDLHPDMKGHRGEDFAKLCLVGARNSPMLRHSPGPSGGRQSRTKWPALASSAAAHCLRRAQFIDFDGASSFGNRGDQIGEVFHGFLLSLARI